MTATNPPSPESVIREFLEEVERLDREVENHDCMLDRCDILWAVLKSYRTAAPKMVEALKRFQKMAWHYLCDEEKAEIAAILSTNQPSKRGRI